MKRDPEEAPPVDIYPLVYRTVCAHGIVVERVIGDSPPRSCCYLAAASEAFAEAVRSGTLDPG